MSVQDFTEVIANGYGSPIVVSFHDDSMPVEQFMKEVTEVTYAATHVSGRTPWTTVATADKVVKKNVVDDNGEYPLYTMVSEPPIEHYISGVGKWIRNANSHVRGLGAARWVSGHGGGIDPRVIPFFLWTHGMNPKIRKVLHEKVGYGCRIIVVGPAPYEWMNQRGSDFTDGIWYTPPKP